ncbi:unnamed protein product [Amoebophrya sp. A120]|nr:unnamed protein product [Amoebophrya sp. A120]|eukprot:GSA120T00001135001.1
MGFLNKRTIQFLLCFGAAILFPTVIGSHVLDHFPLLRSCCEIVNPTTKTTKASRFTFRWRRSCSSSHFTYDTAQRCFLTEERCEFYRQQYFPTSRNRCYTCFEGYARCDMKVMHFEE